MMMNGDGNSTTNLSPSAYKKQYSSLSVSSASLTPIKLFPSCLFEELKSKYGTQNVKLIHMIRHAEGTHNVNKEYKLEINMDAPLTDKGIQQCVELSKSQQVQAIIESHKKNDKPDIAIITSSMTRCIQTVVHTFPSLLDLNDQNGDPNMIPFIAHEAFRETVNYNCDRRRSLSQLQNDFRSHNLDFTLLEGQEHDPIWEYWRRRLPDSWNEHMESAQLHKVVERAWQGLLYVATQRQESQIVICSHSAFLRCILNWNQHGGVPQLIPQDSLDDHLNDLGDDNSNEGTDAYSTTGSISNLKDQKVFEYYDEIPDHDDKDKANGDVSGTASMNAENDGSTKPVGAKTAATASEFEESMRCNYENAELRSFVAVFHDNHYQ